MDIAFLKEVIQLMLPLMKQVLHRIGVQKDSMILYLQQNGLLVLMLDLLFMERQALEHLEHMTVLKIYYGLHWQEQDYQMHQTPQVLLYT